MTTAVPSASYSLTVRLEIENKPGMLGKVTSAIGKAGGDIGAVDLVEMSRGRVLRDITIKASDSQHGQLIREALEALEGVRVRNVSDRTFLMHLGGKIEMRRKVPLRNRDDLSMAYTPGVARVCMAIAENPARRSPSPSSATPSRSSPTAPPSWAWATSAPTRRCRSWRARPRCSSSSPTSTPGRSAWTPRTPTRSSRSSRPSPPASAASTWRTSPRRAASRSRAACARSSTSPSSTTTSTAPRSWCWRRSPTRCKVVGKEIGRLKVVVSGVGAAGTAVGKLLLARRGARTSSACDRTVPSTRGRKPSARTQQELAGGRHQPGRASAARSRGHRRRRRLHRRLARRTC